MPIVSRDEFKLLRQSNLVRQLPASGVPPQDNAALQTLGKRMERLFFWGMVLVAASFADVYFATANLQITKDTASAPLAALLKEIDDQKPLLDTLYTFKPLSSTAC